MFLETKAAVFEQGHPPDSFLTELVAWGKSAAESIFAPSPSVDDIYIKIKSELGPWRNGIARRAAMLEVMRVLAGFESSWDWTEGVDTSRLGADTPENSEAGAWQVSYDARQSATELRIMLELHGIRNGVAFQHAMKGNHILAMEFVARLLRHNTKHNGPLYKGDERLVIRKSLREPKHSIYPWLSRPAMVEFETLLT